MSGIEIVASIAGITHLLAEVTSKAWKISEAWRDAPQDLHWLRDDLTRTQNFFSEIEAGVGTLSNKLQEGEKGPQPVKARVDELQRLLDQGVTILHRIEAVVDKVYQISKMGSDEGYINLNKRARLYWTSFARRELVGLRKELAEVRSSVCRQLIFQNV